MPTVTLIVDSRIRIVESTIDPAVISKIRDRFVHVNPSHSLKKRLGLPAWGEPPVHRTWKREEGIVSFPRGGMAKIRAELEISGWNRIVQDRRTTGKVVNAGFIPASKVVQRDYQEVMIAAAIRRENCLLRAGTGCVSGDAQIGVSRAGKSFSLSLSEVVRRFNGGVIANRTWNHSIPTYVRSVENGMVRLRKIRSASVSGSKITVLLILDNYSSVRLTHDHRVMTMCGWKEVQDLTHDDMVAVEGSPEKKTTKKKATYKVVAGLRSHPYASRRNLPSKSYRGGWSVPSHHLVVEAFYNGLDYQTYIDRLRTGDVSGLLFLPKAMAVHHIDGDHKNNRIENLEVCTHSEHFIKHGQEGGWKRINSPMTFASIVSIDSQMVVPTYDLEMEGDPNFLANGIQVHNSGKTTAAIALASRLGLYTLVIVWSASLFDQWIERIERELGIPEKEIGIIRAQKTKLAPITVAMQQTLAARGPENLPLDVFGCVICDEVQRFAAKTLFDAVDIWPAKYRVGISADESRKDRKEYLIYDLFGEVAADIKRDDLTDAGNILEVEIRIVPTEFRADWYKETRDFNALLKAMTEDGTREDLIVETTRDELRTGQQAFLLSHRREHCTDLAKRLSGHYKTGLLLGGEEDSEAFGETKRAMDSGAILCGVGTIQAIAQGLDIPRIGRIIVATPMAANRQLFGQARGRVCRTAPGKKNAILYYLWDQHVYGIAHVENLAKWNRAVTVKSGGEWIPVKEYIKTFKSGGGEESMDFGFLDPSRGP